MPVSTLDMPFPALGPEPGAEQAALAGDRDAWSLLVARHTRRVVLALVAAGVAPALAREFTQDAWVKLMDQAAQGKLSQLSLPGLAVRQALFLARSAGRRFDARSAAALDPEAPAQPSAEAALLAKERLAAALRVLDGCGGSARRVFTLAYSRPELSHADIARQVGLSVQRVRQIICEVRKKLRASVDERSP